MGSAPQRQLSEETARMIDAEVRRIIEECHEEALRLLNEHRSELDALATALLERETLDDEAIHEVTGLPPNNPVESVKLARATSDDRAVAMR
jgi:cell division protease FtsH